MKKFSFEIECNRGGYDGGPFRSYGTIITEGTTLEELYDNATVDVVDQDGGDCGYQSADEDWMQRLILKKYLSEVQGQA